MNVLNDLIGLDVKLRHVQGDFLLLAQQTHLHVLLYTVLKYPRHWVPEQVVPLDSLVWIHH